jgi:hypothetical protein
MLAQGKTGRQMEAEGARHRSRGLNRLRELRQTQRVETG